MPRRSSLLPWALLLAAAAPLGACSSADYLNHRDRITLAGGDAVRRNLERETLNPAKASMYKLGGLGQDGGRVPAQVSLSEETSISE